MDNIGGALTEHAMEERLSVACKLSVQKSHIWRTARGKMNIYNI
jgi:hypothetical protein